MNNYQNPNFGYNNNTCNKGEDLSELSIRINMLENRVRNLENMIMSNPNNNFNNPNYGNNFPNGNYLL